MADHASREKMLAEFGVFAVAFEPIGEVRNPYLTLLSLNAPEEARVVVDVVRRATMHDGVEGYLLTLLKDVNWRPHLVAAVATWWLRSGSVLQQAWRALDAGSWVAPQLAASLSLTDRDFFSRACDRLEAGCPILRDPEHSVSNPIERHSYQGPASTHQRSSKSAVALLSLLHESFPSNQKVNELTQSSSIQELIDSDIDDSGGIAVDWKIRFQELIRSLPKD